MIRAAHWTAVIVAVIMAACVAACGADPPLGEAGDAAWPAAGDAFTDVALQDAAADTAPDAAPDAALLDAAADVQPDAPDAARDASPRFPPPGAVVAVTFNTGSGPELPHDRPPDDGYGSAEAALTDTWYGNGLAWLPLIIDVHAFLTRIDPDLIAFQEIFHPGDCPAIPPEAHPGFVCAEWQPGDPTVAQRVLGPGWQVACHPGKPDKCLAAHSRFGRFIGCDANLCLDGLDGAAVEGCGRGARVARGRLALTAAAAAALGLDSPLTVVSFHGTSGFSAEEQACRVAQVEQVFVDLGDGQPGVGRAGPAVVLGDLNTDPGLAAGFDPSAARWLDFVGPDAGERGFRFISAIGPDAPRTYAGAFAIDHVVAAGLTGHCEAPGVTVQPGVTEAVFFDHVPVVCGLDAIGVDPGD